jgi:hypothetical protein
MPIFTLNIFSNNWDVYSISVDLYLQMKAVKFSVPHVFFTQILWPHVMQFLTLITGLFLFPLRKSCINNLKSCSDWLIYGSSLVFSDNMAHDMWSKDLCEKNMGHRKLDWLSKCLHEKHGFLHISNHWIISLHLPIKIEWIIWKHILWR